MNTYAENLAIAGSCVTRNHHNVREIRDPEFWMNDVNQEVEIEHTAQDGWLRVKNHQAKAISFFPIDGKRNVISANDNPLPVKDGAKFSYQRTKFDDATQTQIIETKSAGRCECLLLDERWRFFEFKTQAGTNPLSAENNRVAAEMQLARTITYFREKTLEKGNGRIDAIFEGVIVTKPDFYPATPASLINRGSEFFLDFQARLIEITTEETYVIS